MIRAIQPAELHALLRAGGDDPGLEGGKVRVFDVRPEEDYLEGHAAGARHLPVSQALRWIPQRAHTQEMVVLIDEEGAREGAARHVAHDLAHRWFRRVRFLEGGFKAWLAQGLPVESGGEAGQASGSHDGVELEFKTSGEVPWRVPLRPGTPDPTRARF